MGILQLGTVILRAPLVVQTVKNLPAMQETWIRPMNQDNPLEEGMASYSPAFMPGESHGQRSLVGHSPHGHKEWDTTK